MTQAYKAVSLGFASQTFPAGVHICQIYSSEEERRDSLEKFLLSGLLAGEKTACFSESLDEASLAELLEQHGVSCSCAKENGSLATAGTKDIYFQDGRFDPDRMLDMLRKYYLDSVADGYPAARVIGEMTPEVLTTPGGDRLLEYEARVSMLLKDHPVTAVCQYDARLFDGATIMQVLKAHPLMVIRGSVVHNPFYIQPEELLKMST